MAGKGAGISLRGVSRRIHYERAQDPKLAAYLKQAEALHRVYTYAEECEAAARIQAGDLAARRSLIESNLLLVVKVAAVFCGQGMPLMDLTGFGNIGLIMAVDAYDPPRVRRKARFGTYATWKIRASVGRSLVDKGTVIRVAHNVVALRKRLYRLEGSALAYGRRLDDDEAATALTATPTAIRKARRAQDKPLSLDYELNGRHGSPRTGEDGEYFSLTDTIADPAQDTEASVIDRLDSPALRAGLARGLAALSERDRRIITARFYDGATLETIGAQLGINRETVRQAERRILTSLRCQLDPDYAPRRPVTAARAS